MRKIEILRCVVVGALELMKPAREPASSRPKPCASLRNATRILSVRRCLLALVGENRRWSEISFSLRNLPIRAADSRAQGLNMNIPLGSSTIELPYSPDRALLAFRDSVPCLSRAATPPEGHQIGARKRRARGSTILNQPCRRRVSTDRLNRAKTASWLYL